MINLAEAFAVGVVRVMKFQQGAIQHVFNIRLVPAVEGAELLEVCQHGQRRAAVPTVANRLKVIITVIEIEAGFSGFDVEAHVAEVRREESVIGAAAALAPRPAALDFHFLLVQVAVEIRAGARDEEIASVNSEVDRISFAAANHSFYLSLVAIAYAHRTLTKICVAATANAAVEGLIELACKRHGGFAPDRLNDWLDR